MLRTLVAFALVSLFATGCAFFGKTVEKPTAQVRAVSVGAVSFSGIDGEVALDIQNPNAFGVPLSAIDWPWQTRQRIVCINAEASASCPASGSWR